MTESDCVAELMKKNKNKVKDEENGKSSILKYVLISCIIIVIYLAMDFLMFLIL